MSPVTYFDLQKPKKKKQKKKKDKKKGGGWGWSWGWIGDGDGDSGENSNESEGKKGGDDDSDEKGRSGLVTPPETSRGEAAQSPVGRMGLAVDWDSEEDLVEIEDSEEENFYTPPQPLFYRNAYE